MWCAKGKGGAVFHRNEHRTRNEGLTGENRNITKTGRIEKGISTFFIGMQFKKPYKNISRRQVRFGPLFHTADNRNQNGGFLRKETVRPLFDAKRHFPQNACDIGLLKKTDGRPLYIVIFEEKKNNCI